MYNVVFSRSRGFHQNKSALFVPAFVRCPGFGQAMYIFYYTQGRPSLLKRECEPKLVMEIDPKNLRKDRRKCEIGNLSSHKKGNDAPLGPRLQDASLERSKNILIISSIILVTQLRHLGVMMTSSQGKPMSSCLRGVKRGPPSPQFQCWGRVRSDSGLLKYIYK